MRRAMFIVVSGMILGFVASVMAQGMMWGGRGPGAMMSWGKGLRGMNLYLNLREELKLTDEQVKVLKAIDLDHRRNTIKVWTELRLKGLELEELMNQPKVSRAKVDDIIKEMGELRTKLMLNAIHTELEVRKILTEEQLKRTKKLAPWPRLWFMGRHRMMRWMHEGMEPGH